MSKEKQIENKKFYVVHTTQGYWVGTYIFSEQLRHAKIYTSLHYANETAERLKGYNAKILEVDLCLAEDRAGYRRQIEGEWIDRFKGEFINPIYVCSLCGKGTLLKPHINELRNMEMEQALSPFCPNCGAKMKGGAE